MRREGSLARAGGKLGCVSSSSIANVAATVRGCAFPAYDGSADEDVIPDTIQWELRDSRSADGSVVTARRLQPTRATSGQGNQFEPGITMYADRSHKYCVAKPTRATKLATNHRLRIDSVCSFNSVKGHSGTITSNMCLINALDIGKATTLMKRT